jgi:hypothetical protein
MLTTANIFEYPLSVHGVRVCYRTSSPVLCSALGEWFHYFRHDNSGQHPPLVIHFEEVSHREAIPVSLSPSAYRRFDGLKPALNGSVPAFWRCEVFEDRGRLILDVHHQGVMVIDRERGMVQGYFFQTVATNLESLESFFRYALAELLKYRSLFMLNGAALERDGLGLLIAGSSGCGKTTALLSLLRSGYRYLSDDHPLLLDGDSGIQLLAAPMKVEVTEQTVALCPELRNARPALFRQGVYKKSFHVEDIHPVSTTWRCKPAMILFPHLTKISHSCLEPLSKSAALHALMPQLSFIHDEAAATREFKALSNLVALATCYRLHFGTDVLDLPQLVTPLLDGC